MNTDRQSNSWLFVLPWEISYPGGVNQVVINLINQFQVGKKLNPRLWIDQYSGTLEEIHHIIIDYFPLSNPCWTHGLLGFIKYFIKLPFLLWHIQAYLRKNNVRFVNAHYPTLNVLNFILCKLLKLYSGKIVLSFHGTDLASLKKTKGFEKHLWRFILKKSDFIVCCAEYLTNDLKKYLPDCIHKIKVIYNGVDQALLQSYPEERLPYELHQTPFILHVGTFTHNKNQSLLIQAFSQVKSLYPALKLVCIGRTGETLSSNQKLAQKLACEQDIIFIENLEHEAVLPFFQYAEIFCLPSYSEAFPIVLLEAGLFACPVIASAVGGIPEMIENGKEGYLIQPDDTGELVTRIQQLLRNHPMRQKMGEQLKNKVLEKFSWDVASFHYSNL